MSTVSPCQMNALSFTLSLPFRGLAIPLRKSSAIILCVVSHKLWIASHSFAMTAARSEFALANSRRIPYYVVLHHRHSERSRSEFALANSRRIPYYVVQGNSMGFLHYTSLRYVPVGMTRIGIAVPSGLLRQSLAMTPDGVGVLRVIMSGGVSRSRIIPYYEVLHHRHSERSRSEFALANSRRIPYYVVQGNPMGFLHYTSLRYVPVGMTRKGIAVPSGLPRRARIACTPTTLRSVPTSRGAMTLLGATPPRPQMFRLRST